MPEEDKEELESFEGELKGAGPKESKTEKLEFLKREEIRTMQKDIKKLREIEAKKERKRIIALQTKAKKVKAEPKVKPEIGAEPLAEGILIPKPPKKPAPFQKILVRLVIILFCIFLFWFNYWFFIQKPPVEEISPPEEEISPPEEPPEEVPEEPLEKPEITIPPSLISIEQTLTAEVSEIEEIPEALEQLMKEELPEGSFVRIIIKNQKENRLVDLEEVAQSFQVELSSEVLQKLKIEDSTILIYSQKEGKRGVLISKIEEKEGLEELLKEWEVKIEKEGLFISQGEIPVLASSFKSFALEEIPIRYLTISKKDLGICYALFSDHFILTTSFEGLRTTIKALKSQIITPVTPSPKDNTGQLFIIGFEGKTITPQLEELFKKYRPGGVLLLSRNIENKEQLKTLIEGLQSLSQKETGLSLFIAVDQEGGSISRIEFLEEKTAQSAIKDTDDAYNIGLKRANELKELGVNLNLAPLLDDMKSGDFYFNRSFQKSPEIAGLLAKSLILGQKEVGILTSIKHFPGYVDVAFNPESKLATISLPEASQFQKAMEAEPEMVMASNAIYQEIDSSLPFTFSTTGVQFLRNNLGSDVLIMADDLAQNSLLENFPLKEIVIKPIQAGVDILIFSGWRAPVEQGLDAFFEAVKNKEVSETRINEAVSKIIQLKESLLK